MFYKYTDSYLVIHIVISVFSSCQNLISDKIFEKIRFWNFFYNFHFGQNVWKKIRFQTKISKISIAVKTVEKFRFRTKISKISNKKSQLWSKISKIFISVQNFKKHFDFGQNFRRRNSFAAQIFEKFDYGKKNRFPSKISKNSISVKIFEKKIDFGPNSENFDCGQNFREVSILEKKIKKSRFRSKILKKKNRFQSKISIISITFKIVEKFRFRAKILKISISLKIDDKFRFQS